MTTKRYLLPIVLLALGACTEQARRTGAAPTGVPNGRPRLQVTVPAGMSLRCPPRPTVTARSVEPGAELDVNGNGIVCDERLVAPGLVHADGRVITSDDVPLPDAPGGVSTEP